LTATEEILEDAHARISALEQHVLRLQPQLVKDDIQIKLAPTTFFSNLETNAGGACVYCCNLSGGVALIVSFTTNGMCVMNKNIYAWREQAIMREIATHDLYCCLLPRCKALCICRSGFPIAPVHKGWTCYHRVFTTQILQRFRWRFVDWNHLP